MSGVSPTTTPSPIPSNNFNIGGLFEENVNSTESSQEPTDAIPAKAPVNAASSDAPAVLSKAPVNAASSDPSVKTSEGSGEQEDKIVQLSKENSSIILDLFSKDGRPIKITIEID